MSYVSRTHRKAWEMENTEHFVLLVTNENTRLMRLRINNVKGLEIAGLFNPGPILFTKVQSALYATSNLFIHANLMLITLTVTTVITILLISKLSVLAAIVLRLGNNKTGKTKTPANEWTGATKNPQPNRRGLLRREQVLDLHSARSTPLVSHLRRRRRNSFEVTTEAIM